MKKILFFILIISNLSSIFAQKEQIQNSINEQLDGLEKMYLTLHQNPELSLQETETAKRVAQELRNSGYEVYENFGGGVVGVLKNGKGPTVLVRADMDALPVREETGDRKSTRLNSSHVD